MHEHKELDPGMLRCLCDETVFEFGSTADIPELYAFFSSLSGVSIRQGFAVTGSVSQQGEVQPIGGATRKIEG